MVRHPPARTDANDHHLFGYGKGRSYDDQKAIDEIVNAGASGYVLKESASSDLLGAMRRVCKGQTAFSPSIEKRHQHRHRCEQFDGPKAATLTPRESETVQLIAEGFTNKAIAAELHISIKTVEKHRQQVMNKLNIHDTAGLTRYAIANSFIALPA